MLKRMRRRFVSAAMSAFVTVILLLLISINIWNYHTITVQLDSTISVLQGISNGEIVIPTESPNFPGNNFSPEVQYTIRFFTVSYDKNGALENINQDYIASVSGEDAESYAEAVTVKGSNSGYYNGYRYKIVFSDSGTQVIFLNAERELQTTRTLIIITSIIALICLAAVFLLTFIFSKRAIAPFIRNAAAQKEFITNASHELKTPLTAISTSADVLALEHPEDEWVHNIQNQSVKLSSLISKLVTLSRLDEEHPSLERSEFSLSDICWEMYESFASRAQASGKQLIPDIEDNVNITADSSSIRQLVSVLIDNALKYSDEDGDIRLHVSHLGKKACLEISNPCSSCSSLNTSRLFDRFYRAEVSHGGNISGSGIGLSIAKAAAEANGGILSVQAKGNTIFFKFIL